MSYLSNITDLDERIQGGDSLARVPRIKLSEPRRQAGGDGTSTATHTGAARCTCVETEKYQTFNIAIVQ